MQIYADPITVKCRKKLAGLGLMGAPYELKHVDCFKGEQKAEPYLSLNPNASIRAATRKVLRQAEDVSGKGIEFIREDDLPVLTTIQTARTGEPATCC